MLEVVAICIHGRWSALRPMSEHGFGRKLQDVMRLCATEDNRTEIYRQKEHGRRRNQYDILCIRSVRVRQVELRCAEHRN